jgi:hypothetical protein
VVLVGQLVVLAQTERLVALPRRQVVVAGAGFLTALAALAQKMMHQRLGLAAVAVAVVVWP